MNDFLRATLHGGPAIALTSARLRNPGSGDPGLVARRIDGASARTLPGLFEAYAWAWDFPGYFGGNKDAFNDCMTDLDDGRFSPAGGTATTGFLTVVTRAEQFLADAPPADRAWFAQSQAGYRDDYRTVNAYGADRPVPLQFGVVLHTDLSHLRTVTDRWRAAGASPAVLITNGKD
ncbi:barstar family protein [Gordonia hirsuta]|uniref:barstar family protein n=1 Tax=Gordonia hirsuta TaxID=53427 RepID=UPI000344AE3C|nr:barstar family protein [Gordonia hirsuta]